MRFLLFIFLLSFQLKAHTFKVFADGKLIEVYEQNDVPLKHALSSYKFARVTFSGKPIRIKLQSSDLYFNNSEWSISPKRYNINGEKSGNQISFRMDRLGYVVIRLKQNQDFTKRLVLIFEAPEIIFAWSVITNPGVSTDIYTDIIETVKVSVGAGSQPLGYSLQFTGDGYVSIGDVLDINNSSQTWECWFKLPDPGTADNIRLIDKRGQGGFGSAGISGMQLSFNNVGFGNTGIQAVSGDYVNTAGQSILSSDLYDNT